MDVHAGNGSFYGAQNVAVVERRQIARQAALDADFSGAQFPGSLLCGPCLRGMKVRVGLSRAAAEAAKLAADETDVGEIDIAVDHVGDNVADQIRSQRVGGRQQREQIGAV